MLYGLPVQTFNVAVWATRGVGRFAIRTIVDGVDVITIEHVDRMAEDLASNWPKSRTGGIDGTWRVIIDGEPSFDAEFEVGHRPDEDSSEQGLLATGMRAVNVIPWVCAAEPGIVDALHPRRDGIPAF